MSGFKNEPEPTYTIVLASTSPTRRAILVDAGIRFEVEPSRFEEVFMAVPVPSLVHHLAIEKAHAVSARRHTGLVLGCDSLLELDGAAVGKPDDAEMAIARWRSYRGRTATLFTGHVLVDASSGLTFAEVVGTEVRFGHPSDAEIEAYVATGEPLDKAGAFTLEGRSSAFIEGIVGDPGNVRGLSMPALARLLAQHGRSVAEFWTEQHRHA